MRAMMPYYVAKMARFEFLAQGAAQARVKNSVVMLRAQCHKRVLSMVVLYTSETREIAGLESVLKFGHPDQKMFTGVLVCEEE
ncbi:hypothetical protein NDU88_000329 [Pleurodeles waltl]|uniref:Uncharacterized protein n=1 Tax=Pleurodeles waltl TaxID=8319 RepID=A0AAV7TEM7_PLEWA|nr:hypothetical protein NDU88_000329 [Pleurodeles waltl]